MSHRKFYQLIGECGSDYNSSNQQAVVFALELGISFLKETLGPPPASGVLEVLWATYDGQTFPTIAIAYTDANVLPAHEKAITQYQIQGLDLLRVFHGCVNWSTIDKSLA